MTKEEIWNNLKYKNVTLREDIYDAMDEYANLRVTEVQDGLTREIHALVMRVKELEENRRAEESKQELYEIIKSDSVYRLLRFGYKSPSSSGVDDCEDDKYYDLYQICCDLRQKDIREAQNNEPPK